MKIKQLFGFFALIVSIPAVGAESIKEMLSQGSFRGEISLMNFTRDFEGSTLEQQDTAVGGTLFYQSDTLNGITVGGAFATTNGLFTDDEKGFYYGLTAPPDHASVTRLQEYYVQGEFNDTIVKIGAQELNTPFLGIHPVRMFHRTYRGLSVVNKSIENLSLMGYYLTDHMGWVDDEFIPFSKDVLIAGASYTLPTESMNANVEAWYFTMPDNINQAFFKANFSKKVNELVFHFTPTFFSQKAQEHQLNDLDTYQYGFNAGVSGYGFDLTGFYSKTGDDSVYDPWSYGKIIIQQYGNSGNDLFGDRHDENAYAARISYDFSNIGLKGLRSYIYYAYYDAPESLIKETNFDLKYAFSGSLDGLNFRIRYAIVDKESWQEDFDDIRFILTYKFGVKGS